MERAKRLSLEITFYVVRSGNEQFSEQRAEAFGEVPRLQAGARRPLKAGLKRNVLKAQTRSASEFIQEDCAASKERQEKLGVYS